MNLNISIDDQILPMIMKLPDALKTEKPELPEEEWNLVKEQILESVRCARSLPDRGGKID